MRLIPFSLSIVLVAALAGCPDREELVDQVGGAPGRQMQDVRTKVKAAEQKEAARATAATTTPSEQ